MDYNACLFDEFWWVGIAEDVSEFDIKVKFMHLHGPVKNFFWSIRNDKCWVLISKVPKPDFYINNNIRSYVQRI